MTELRTASYGRPDSPPAGSANRPPVSQSRSLPPPGYLGQQSTHPALYLPKCRIVSGVLPYVAVSSGEPGEDHDVAEVPATRPVEDAAAGDQAQLRVRHRAVHRRGRELVLGELLDLGHGEDGHRPVGAAHVDAVTAVQRAQPEEDAGPGAGVDVTGDDGGADRARPRAPGEPARHRGARRHLERAVTLDTEVDQPGPDRERRDTQPGRPGRLRARRQRGP